jgi:galacturonokinase
MSPETDTERLKNEVATRYQVDSASVRVVFAPYRICPLGAHIDHQGGQVTAMALDRGVSMAYAPVMSPSVRVSSLEFPGEVAFEYARVPERKLGEWGDYLRGAAQALQQETRLRRGIVGVTQGSVHGGGLSSSAAVGVAYLMALQDVNHLQVTPQQNILFDQYIENTYLGLKNGILDQAAILLSRSQQLTWINCQTVEHQHYVRPPGSLPFRILIFFSGLRQALVTTDYNRRVSECAEAARVLLRAVGRDEHPPVLGRVTHDEYTRCRHQLHGAAARRAAHYFSEMERVAAGVVAWQRGDLEEFGRLISVSGESSIQNYQCGAPPLIALYEMLRETDGVYGARFSGAGFRGCCLALVDPQRVAEAAASVKERYVARFPNLADHAGTMVCQSGDGARFWQE